MFGLIKNRIKKSKSYVHEIGLQKGDWVKVFIDYVITHYHYGFSAYDYFVRGNGYTLSKYEKKRYFTLKRAFWLQDHVNNPEYAHFLLNKAEALNLFKDLVQRSWLYTPKSSFEDFVDFINKTPVFIAKPVGGMGGVWN